MDMGAFLLNFSLFFMLSAFVLSSPIPTVKTVAASLLQVRGSHTGRVCPNFDCVTYGQHNTNYIYDFADVGNVV